MQDYVYGNFSNQSHLIHSFCSTLKFSSNSQVFQVGIKFTALVVRVWAGPKATWVRLPKYSQPEIERFRF